MSGTVLHTTLLDHGASLHLDGTGTLRILPASVAQRYHAAIAEHLCFLLTCAAVAEVQRLTHVAPYVAWTGIRPMVNIVALNAACLSGDVGATRVAAVAYVAAWQAWLNGEAA